MTGEGGGRKLRQYTGIQAEKWGRAGLGVRFTVRYTCFRNLNIVSTIGCFRGEGLWDGDVQ